MSQTTVHGPKSGPSNITDSNQINLPTTPPPSGLHGQVAMGPEQDAMFPTMPPTTGPQGPFKGLGRKLEVETWKRLIAQFSRS